MAWIKQSILAGHPVIIGVFYNRRMDHVNMSDISAALQKHGGSIGHANSLPLGLRTFNESEGDYDYDHIITVTGIDLADGGADFHARDTMRFADHEGLSDRMIFEELPRDRTGANQMDRVYSLNTLSNWGLRINGIVDTDHSALPVRLRILSSSAHAYHTHDDDEYGPLIPSGAFYDFPDMHVGGRERPALPRSVQLRVEVSVRGLRPGDRFILCRFLRADAVPTSAFAACAGKADTWWTITATSPVSETAASAPQPGALDLPTGTGVISRDFSAAADSSAHSASVWVQWKRTDMIFASDTVFYRAALLPASPTPGP